MLLAAVSVRAQDDTEPERMMPAKVYHEPFDRGIGLPNNRFIPKGTIGGGLTVSYSSYALGNAIDDAGYKMLFSLLSGIEGYEFSHGHVSTSQIQG